jgi:hypothetical protein
LHKTEHEKEEGAASMRKAAPKAKEVKKERERQPGSPAAVVKPGQKERAQHRASTAGGQQDWMMLEDWNQQKAAAAAAAGVRTGRVTEFGSGASAMITMVGAMLEEGVLLRPEGEAGKELEKRVEAFKRRKAGRMYVQEE